MPTEPQWSRMELNHRFLGVDQVSWPLDHGTVFLKWSHRESHPDLQRAMLASSCWTMTPCSFKRKPWGSNPQAACLPPPAFHAGSSPIRMTSVINLTKAEADQRCDRCPDSNSQAVISRHLFSRQGPHPAGWLPLFKLRRLESNQHEDVQSVSSYR